VSRRTVLVQLEAEGAKALLEAVSHPDVQDAADEALRHAVGDLVDALRRHERTQPRRSGVVV
jgi:hypothetical protein